MTVEFISAINVREGDELNPQRHGRPLDPAYLKRYARTLEDAGFDYTLVPYGSASADSFVVATAVAAAHRAHQADRRAAAQHHLPDRRGPAARHPRPAHGGPRRRAHHLGRQRRRAGPAGRLPDQGRALRPLGGVHRASCAEPGPRTAPFSHDGHVLPVRRTSGPGSGPQRRRSRSRSADPSDDAYRVGGAVGDIFGLWGEPLADTRDQIDRVEDGRPSRRPGGHSAHLGDVPPDRRRRPTSWRGRRRTHTSPRSPQTYANAGLVPFRQGRGVPQNVGSQRLLDAAARGEVHDRALWTKPAEVTNAGGASTALVGSYETVAAAILDYVDLGADLISIRGYDNLNDAIDYGRYVLPLVRQELAHREATGSRGRDRGAAAPIVEGVRA